MGEIKIPSFNFYFLITNTNNLKFKVMGQRHQIFLKIHNPLKNKEVLDDISLRKEVFKHAKKVFGDNDTSILPYHNQWLYGMSAAAVCFNIMEQVEKSKSPYHILSKEIDELPYPVDYSGDKDKVDGFLEVVDRIINTQFNIEFAEAGSRYGIEKSFSLINQYFDKEGNYDKGSDIRLNFRLGDNNDGIMIIDVVNKKYCFIRDIYVKPSKIKVIDAAKYVNLYYATTRKKLGEYYVENVCGNDETKIKKLLETNTKKVEFVKKMFANFNVLSPEEVKEIFPLAFEEKTKVETK
jgi:hypothetical protein